MTWLRLHTDILGDPKLMRASRMGAKYLHLTPWLLAFAKQADDGGRLSVGKFAAEPRDIVALVPCVTSRAIQGCMKELQVLDVLVEDEDGVLRFRRWEPRQSKPSATPEAARERQARHRGKAKEREDVTPPVSHPANTERGVTVTPKRGVIVTPPEEKRGEEKRGEEKGAGRPYSPAPEETQVFEEIPEQAVSAPEGAPTAQEERQHRDRQRAGFRLLAQDTTP